MAEKEQLTAQDLALYLGCEAIYTDELGNDRKLVIDNIWQDSKGRPYIKHGDLNYHGNRIKPILRPLSDMTGGGVCRIRG